MSDQNQPNPQAAGTGTLAQAGGTQPNRISEGDYGRLQARFQNAPTPVEANACLVVMLNKRHGLTPETLRDTLGFRQGWSEGVIEAWNGGGLTMMQSYAGSNGTPWGS